MSDKKLSEKLYFEITAKRNLKASKQKVINLIYSLLHGKPEIKNLLKNKEIFTEDDLKLVLSYLSSDKRIDKKMYQKKYISLLILSDQNEFDKSMIYEAILLALFVFLSFLISIIRLSKSKSVSRSENVNSKHFPKKYK
jgi:hypothetical protein